jgi:hypothetical protein
MQTIVGYFLVIVGAGMEIVSVLVWLGVLKPATDTKSLRAATFWDVILELVRRAPWPAAVGLILIYAGLKMINMVLPF